MQCLDFSHQGFVNSQATGGINQQDIKVMFTCVVQRGFGDIYGLLVRRTRKPIGARLSSNGFELLNCGRTVNVTADCQYFLFARHQPLGQLSGCGGLTRPLQTRHEYYGWWLGG